MDSNNSNQKPIHGSYGSLVLHPKWKAKRQQILERDNYQCVFCGSTEDLQVHHRQYHLDSQGRKYVPWNYDDKYLLTVCSRCHQKGHLLYHVPSFIINDDNSNLLK